MIPCVPEDLHDPHAREGSSEDGWASTLAELSERRASSRSMGGAERLARHGQGPIE